MVKKISKIKTISILTGSGIKMNGNKRIINVLIFAALFFGTYLLLVGFDLAVDFQTGLPIFYGLLFFVYALMLKFGWIEKPTPQNRKSVADPFNHLKIQDHDLYINKHKIPLVKIKKIVLDKVKALDGNTEQGLVQLPFNQQKGQIPELWFDAKHLKSLKDFLKQHIPQAEFIK